MHTTSDIDDVRNIVRDWRQKGHRIAFVPTMGNLHAGHLTLVERAAKIADKVVVSIFVNPMQFAPGEDFASYPRTLDDDKRNLADFTVDMLYLPDAESIYPNGPANTTVVDVTGISAELEGQSRAGFFQGVCTVVNKLFNIVQPDVAVFGEKDYQQLIIVSRMVDELNMPIEIVSCATIREDSGLAMSSRNDYLDRDERVQAAVMYQVIQRAAEKIHIGADFTVIENDTMVQLREEGFEPDYVSVRRQADLGVPSIDDLDLVVLVAASMGGTRLIDNLQLELKTVES